MSEHVHDIECGWGGMCSANCEECGANLVNGEEHRPTCPEYPPWWTRRRAVLAEPHSRQEEKWESEKIADHRGFGYPGLGGHD